MKNIEKYFDEIKSRVKNEGYDATCEAFAIRNNTKKYNINCCNGIYCEECSLKTLEWLNQEYVEPIELTQFEYDLIRNCKEATSYKDSNKLNECWIIGGMKEKGHFKNVDLNMTFKEIFENCVVKDDENNNNSK